MTDMNTAPHTDFDPRQAMILNAITDMRSLAAVIKILKEQHPQIKIIRVSAKVRNMVRDILYEACSAGSLTGQGFTLPSGPHSMTYNGKELLYKDGLIYFDGVGVRLDWSQWLI